MALWALRGRSGPAKGDNSETLCAKNAKGPDSPLVPWGALGGRGCPMREECRVFPFVQREALLQRPSSLEVVLASSPSPLDRASLVAVDRRLEEVRRLSDVQLPPERVS